MIGNFIKIIKQNISGRHIFVVLISVFIITGGIASYILISTELNYRNAQNEYIRLRRYAPTGFYQPAPVENVNEQTNQSDESDNIDLNENASPNEPESMSDLSVINPDYVGWIRINGTYIDYPVVQGVNNTKYLSTTFTGERNTSGAIFKDYRCTPGFSGFTMLHGHNMRNGTMFAELSHFLDPDFFLANSEISIFTPAGDLITYIVSNVFKVNMYDPIFSVPEKDPDEIIAYLIQNNFLSQSTQTSDILILATCITNQKTERLLVIAVN